jgi:para-aminobenzoate synthetase component I
MYDLHLRTLPYRRDSSAMIAAIAERYGAVCLDSGLGEQDEARYDILSAWPTAIVSEQEASVCMFEAADRLLAQYHIVSDLSQLEHLPFCGGLIGFISYDAATQVAPRQISTDEDARVLYSFPRASVGFYHWAIVVDHQRKITECFILPQCPPEIRKQIVNLLAALDHLPAEATADNPFFLDKPFSAAVSTTHYAEAFDRLKEWIIAGDCYQANLSIPFRADFQGKAHSAYQILRRVSRSPFSAWINAGAFSVLSLSPERFLSVHNGKVCTQPIKGTRKRSDEPETDARLREELLHSEKDRAENLMIVDLLRNDLGTVCVTGSVKTESLFSLRSFTHVHHLISTITGELPFSVTPLQLLKQCFPGGSITGAPKIRAMQIIAELETMPRAIYCGSIFYCDVRGEMDSSICIRTLAAFKNRLYCWGGGGIVADSQREQEYQECHDKVAALMAALPVAGSIQGLN